MTLVSSGLLYLGTANNAGTRSIATELGATNAGFCLSDARDVAGSSFTCMSDFYGFTNAFTFDINLSTQEANLATLATAAGWDGSEIIVATLANGIYLWSDDTSVGGLTVPSNIPAGSMIVNNGFIIGRGGNANGGDAGAALHIMAPGFSVVNNSGAFVAGGGGGGNGVTTNLGRGQSAGGGGGAGGGRGSPGSSGASSSSFLAGGAIGMTGGGGAQAGGNGGIGNDGLGAGGGRILPGVASGNGGAGGSAGGDSVGTQAGGGGGWGSNGGSSPLGDGGQGGASIISDTLFSGITGAGTTYGAVAPSIGSELLINDFLNHREISLSGLGVADGDTITIPEDFWIWSDTTTIPALLVDVNNVTIINNGNIIGRGGNGGGATGGDGGDAINVTATGVSITNNSTGFIGGGGGGGMRGVINLNRGQFGGGGGGAGGGRGAFGGSNPRGSNDIIAGGSLGQPGGAGSDAGGSGSFSGPGGGGGRVVPGNTLVGSTNGGGWGAAGGGSLGGAAIAGNAVTLTNTGTISGATP